MTIVDSCEFSLETSDLLRVRGRAARFDPHLHHTFTVALPTKGRVSLRSRWSCERVGEGDVFIINPYEVHSGGSEDVFVEYHTLYPSIRFVRDCLCGRRSASRDPVLRTVVLRKSDMTLALFESLRTGDEAGIAVEVALQRVLQRCEIDGTEMPQRSIAAVRVACQLIHDRSMQPLSTDSLASYVKLHRSHFIRIFHRITGLAPQVYLRQVRVARAREYICAGVTLAEAAQTTGFFDQAHMTREFKKVDGVPPGRLLRDLRRGHA